MSLGRLFVTVGADTKEFERAMDGMQKSMANAGKKIGDVGKGMTKWVTGPIAGAGAGLLALANKTAESGDEIQKMSLRTGFSTEALSELRHAANLSGTSIDGMEKGVKRMSRVILDAERGLATGTRAMDDLGLSVEQLQGLSPEEQFNTLTTAIAEIEDPSRRAALAQEVFGRAGTELLPMMAQGAEGMAAMRQEAHDLGIVFDQEGADSAAKFKDDMERLKQGFAGVFQELGTKLIPIFVDDFIPVIMESVIPAVRSFIDRIIDVINWFQELDPAWQKVIGIVVGFLAALGPVLIIIGKIIGVLSTLVPIIKGVGVVFAALTAPIGLVVAAIAAAIAIGWVLYNNWDEVVAFVRGLWERFRDFFIGVWDRFRDRMATFADGFRRVWEGIRDAIKAPVNAIIGFANGIINAFESMVNSVARAINRIPSFSIPSWVPVIGGKSFGLPHVSRVSLPRIPTLHDGGQFRTQGREGLAMLEDGEYVLTESQMAAMSRDINHTGTIRVEGVNSRGQLMDVVDIVISEMRKEVRAT